MSGDEIPARAGVDFLLGDSSLDRGIRYHPSLILKRITTSVILYDGSNRVLVPSEDIDGSDRGVCFKDPPCFLSRFLDGRDPVGILYLFPEIVPNQTVHGQILTARAFHEGVAYFSQFLTHVEILTQPRPVCCATLSQLPPLGLYLKISKLVSSKPHPETSERNTLTISFMSMDLTLRVFIANPSLILLTATTCTIFFTSHSPNQLVLGLLTAIAFLVFSTPFLFSSS